MEKTINYKENIETLFNTLAYMRLTKAQRKEIAQMLQLMAVNGYVAAESNDYARRSDFTYDIGRFVSKASK